MSGALRDARWQNLNRNKGKMKKSLLSVTIRSACECALCITAYLRVATTVAAPTYQLWPPFCEIKKPTFFFLLRGIPHVVVKISLQFFEINGVENVHPDSSNGCRKGTILVIVRTCTTEYRNRIPKTDANIFIWGSNNIFFRNDEFWNVSESQRLEGIVKKQKERCFRCAWYIYRAHCSAQRSVVCIMYRARLGRALSALFTTGPCIHAEIGFVK